MNEHPQTKAVRVQSSAIVLAAVITTCGAVTSALIQTWPAKQSISSTATAPPPPKMSPPALVAEATDMPSELATAFAQAAHTGPQTFQSKSAQSPAAKSPASVVSFHAPIAGVSEVSAKSPIDQKWNVARPELPSTLAASTTKPLISPWYYLQQTSIGESRTASSAAAKKSFDWPTLPRWMQFHN